MGDTNRQNDEFLDLHELLDKERAALLEGAFDGLAPIVAAKERLIESLDDRTRPPTAELAALQAKISRNHALIEGALRGIRTAATRLAAHRGLRRTMHTYDQRGRKQSLSGERGNTVEKRA